MTIGEIVEVGVLVMKVTFLGDLNKKIQARIKITTPANDIQIIFF